MNNEMTTDNMSNEEVIEVLKGIVFNGFDRTTQKERQALVIAIKALENNATGEWIDNGLDYKCSKCGIRYDIDITEITDFKFCPNCGASMKKEVVRNENNKEN